MSNPPFRAAALDMLKMLAQELHAVKPSQVGGREGGQHGDCLQSSWSWWGVRCVGGAQLLQAVKPDLVGGGGSCMILCQTWWGAGGAA